MSSYKTTNPYTGEVVAEFPTSTDEEIRTALDNAHAAFLQWRTTPFATRSAVLQKAADILRASCDDYAATLTLEMGKIIGEAKAEVELCAGIFEYYARNAEALMQPQILHTDPPAKVIHDPQGIVLAVEPWNFPYYQITRILAPQLAAGNVLVLKHASNVPQAGERFQVLMKEAGLPDGCFRNLRPTREQVALILGDQRVCGVALTGSEGAGAVVAAEAAKVLKKSTMELGGADAFIVLKDCDLDKTVEWGVFGRHWNAGQVCVSSKRMIVAAEVYDEYMAKYKEGVARLVAGDPMDPATTLAPLSSQGAVDELKAMIKAAVAAGATAEEVGPKVPTKGAFLQPTILTNVTPSNPAYYQEFFGPVSMIFKFTDEAEAVRIANDSPFGLGGSVFTQDLARGEAIANQIYTGMVFVNQPTRVKADLPFGGVKRSGYGRELINLGIHEFVNHKLVQIADINGPF